MTYLYQVIRIITPIFNVTCIIINFFIRRDKSILLFGGRHGERFAGNSRFLFQYCNKERKKYGFKRVIWVTRKREIYNEMISMGYECYMMHSWSSVYYHLKAGRHIIDGSYISWMYPDRIRRADIISLLSYGAECYYLTHGAKIPKSRAANSASPLIVEQVYKRISNSVFFSRFVLTPGGWGCCINLKNHKDESDYDCNVRITGMPELCRCIKYTPSEESVMDGIPKGKKIILYTPTVRMRKTCEYKAPLNDSSFCRYLLDNNFYWIEKLHPSAGDDMKAKNYDSKFSMRLDNSFDINVMIPKIDILITDYSSIYQKAIWYNIPYAFYIPDFEYFTTHDTHIESWFREFVSVGSYNIEMLKDDIKIKTNLDWLHKEEDSYKRLREEYFNISATNYESICKTLFQIE